MRSAGSSGAGEGGVTPGWQKPPAPQPPPPGPAPAATPSLPPSMHVVEERMRPGVYSTSGFLGADESLTEVLAQDARALHGLGLDYEDLARPLEHAIELALARSRGDPKAPPTPVDDRRLISVVVHKGSQACPWSTTPGRCPVGPTPERGHLEWWIRNEPSGQEMRGSGLAVHLIRDHHFFEGPASRYRTDPIGLARLFEIGPYEHR